MPVSYIAPGAGWTADMVQSGDPVEISNGRRIDVLPTKRGGADASAWGAAVIKSDPMVKRAGVEVGVSVAPGMLRAPDVAVMADEGSDDAWETKAPPLAIEYAGPGQDFKDLKLKIKELLDAGTRYLWVVRLDGPRRVEVYEPGKTRQIRVAGERLAAPGVLHAPIPVEALYNAEAAEAVVLRNLLKRAGYRDLDAVREDSLAEGRVEGHATGHAEGLAEGRADAMLAVTWRQLARRFPDDTAAREALLSGANADDLLWLAEALLDAPSIEALTAGLAEHRA